MKSVDKLQKQLVFKTMENYAYSVIKYFFIISRKLRLIKFPYWY